MLQITNENSNCESELIDIVITARATAQQRVVVSHLPDIVCAVDQRLKWPEQ
jgi:hypothetical protein